MIALIGIPSEPPLALAHAALQALGVPVVMLNQREFDHWGLELQVAGSSLAGRLRIRDRQIPLSGIRGIYARPSDVHTLPELMNEPPNSPRRRRCQLLHDLILRWMELTDARVVNRPAAMASNSSKPYQAQLIAAAGFDVPPTLVTDDGQEVLAFQREYGRVIYKSISGARSIVTELRDTDAERLAQLKGCPVQFQACIPGLDVRVHTIGDAVFAASAASDAVDYRYAGRQGSDLELRPYALDGVLGDRCLSLARSLGLDFAGIDLKITPDGRAVCFEVNPCPAYSFYEEHTGQPIAAALARFLAGRN